MTKGLELRPIAYFSMEIALDPAMPTYSGGLGVLAGDTLRAAADLHLPMVAVTLLYRDGYFRQRLDAEGNQTEVDDEWRPEEFLEPLDARASVTIEGRTVALKAWRYRIEGQAGHVVPVYFLDSALEENDPGDRTLTDDLYGGDPRYRLCQETILGIGGMAMLEAVGHGDVHTCHMNEGHSALLSLALLRQECPDCALADVPPDVSEGVRNRCVFTTHTPVEAGHDRFPVDLVRQVLGDEVAAGLETVGCITDGVLNMTYLGLRRSHYVNGVSMRHEQIAEGMFPGYPFNSVTNGVHAASWTGDAFQELYDRHIPEWRQDNRYLRYVVAVDTDEILDAHAAAKRALVDTVRERNGVELDPNLLTIGFARRATPYKRADLLLSDLDRLRKIAADVGPLQIVYAGKAHPRDGEGKATIKHIFEIAAALKDTIPIVYLEDYDMDLGRCLTSGVDLWVNTPLKPLEASGTSGMKAAMNGVPSLSVLDGWWIEGHVEGVTGWSIGEHWEKESDTEEEVDSLYDKLEYLILPTFYSRPEAFAAIMRSTIALNASFFNSQRMLSQYLVNAYSWKTPEENE